VTRQLPPTVQRLLGAVDPASRDGAWEEFVAEYSKLLLHVARAGAASHDQTMDRYSYVLEQLRSEDCRRLRGYLADGRGKFTTWLVVVVRRLCADEARRRYGRSSAPAENHKQRRELADLLASDIDVNLLPDESSSLPDEPMREAELAEALASALDQLDPGDRLLLRLRFQDEVPAAEIARILSLPTVFHVYRRLNALYERLRFSLREAGVEDARP
jgi:RNA polymerase sigma factor (sigma-70 family)